MKMLIRNFGTLAFIAAIVLGACQSNALTSHAVLEVMDIQSMAEVQSVLARAMKTASIEIGPGDLTQTSTISVLPPRLGPHEDRSTVTPTQFDIVMKGSICFVVRRETGDEYELKGVTCRPLAG